MNETQSGVGRRAALVVVTAAAIAAAALAPTLPAAAADQTVTVDFGATAGTANGVGAGFLYGLSQDGSGPVDGLLAPLAVTSARGGGARLAGGGWVGDGYGPGTGFTTRITSALQQAARVNQLPGNPAYDLLVSDVWGADSTQPSSTIWPCTNGDCGNWSSFLDNVISRVKSAGVKVNWDIWNEPDSRGFWGPPYAAAQYFQMWDTAYAKIHSGVANAVLVGPSVSNFNNSYITSFLDHTGPAGTTPEVVNWHFSGTPVADASTVRGDLSSRGISGRRLAMNEYLNSPKQTAGTQAWYLAQLAASGLSYADHAIWSDCCNVGSLDSTLVNPGSGYQPTGQWWVYQKYADVTGSLAGVTATGATSAVAAKDTARKLATVLLGDNAGNTGTVTLRLNGLTSIPSVFSGSGARLIVQRIPDSKPLAKPTVVSTQTVAQGTASVSVPIAWSGVNDSYFVTLTPVTSTVTTVDDAATASGVAFFQYESGWGQASGVSDLYSGTAHYSPTANTSAVLRFTGTQVSLRAVKDVDQGRMTVSVDGGSPTTIDDYAATRTGSAVVWTSPVLDRGTHTLTVTVAGTKNAASSGTTIALDRADVTP